MTLIPLTKPNVILQINLLLTPAFHWLTSSPKILILLHPLSTAVNQLSKLDLKTAKLDSNLKYSDD